MVPNGLGRDLVWVVQRLCVCVCVFMCATPVWAAIAH